jgi:hypothetical protein
LHIPFVLVYACVCSSFLFISHPFHVDNFPSIRKLLFLYFLFCLMLVFFGNSVKFLLDFSLKNHLTGPRLSHTFLPFSMCLFSLCFFVLSFPLWLLFWSLYFWYSTLYYDVLDITPSPTHTGHVGDRTQPCSC